MLKGIKKYEKKFIVYIHINPTSKDIFYVGIGIKGREKQKIKRSERWKAYVYKYGFEHSVVYSELNWKQACDVEKQLILEIGRIDTKTGNLINMTNGGDGTGGYEGFWKGKSRPPATEETKQKCRENSSKPFLGRKHSEETKAIIKAKRALQDMSWRKGLKMNKPAWNKGVRMWKNKPHPKGMLGKKASDETKKKMSVSHLERNRIKEVA